MVKLGLGQLTVLNKDSSLALGFVLLHLKFYLGGTERIRPVLSTPKIFEKKLLCRPSVHTLVKSVTFFYAASAIKNDGNTWGKNTDTFYCPTLLRVLKK